MDMLVQHLRPLGYMDTDKRLKLSEMGKADYACGTAFTANRDEFNDVRCKDNYSATWLSSFFRTRWYDYLYLNLWLETTVRTDFHKAPQIVCLRSL